MSPTSPVTSSTTASSAAAAANTDPLANEDTFLTLLVSQLQNQDPLNPTDSTQFVTQLTGYSQLEQLINIDNNTTPAATAPASGSGSGSSNSNNSTTTSGI